LKKAAKAARKSRRTPPRATRRIRTDELSEDDGPDEAVALIVEALPALTKLAKRHDLDLLAYLLGMTQMEAEEHLRMRSKRKLS